MEKGVIKQHKDLMNTLKAEHRIIADLIGSKSAAFMDIPVYGNIGDLLIMQGTMKFLKSQEIDITHISSIHNFYKPSVPKDTTIVLQGGGNFGDLYPRHQKFREFILGAYPKNRIIVLPQSIHFQQTESFLETRRIFSSHDDVHLFVRDRNSFAIASEICKNTYLSPDMAHHLYDVPRAKEPTLQNLTIRRTDKESGNINSHVDSMHETDWPKLTEKYNDRTAALIKRMRRMHKFGLGRLFYKRMSNLWISQARDLSDDAINLYSDYNNVTTDRLHGHLLACLMDIPNTVFDNSYGKNSSYIKEWTISSPLVTLIQKEDRRDRNDS